MCTIRKILLDRTLFVVVMAAFTAMVIVTLVHVQFFADHEEPTVAEIMEEEHYRAKAVFPLTLYASPGFSEKQLEGLQAALWVWKDRTDGKMDIRLVPWIPDAPFSEAAYKDNPRHTIWLLDGNDKEVALLWAKYSVKMGGLSVGNFVGIMSDESDVDFPIIAAHEIGHMVGLEHIKPKYPALMNLKTVRYVTQWDLLQFDYLYP